MNTIMATPIHQPVNGIENAWQCWKDLFFSAATSVIPTFKWKRSKMKQWFTSATLHLIRVKRCVYRQMKHFGSDLLKAKYKAISKLVCSQTRKDTSDHVTNLSKSYFANSKKFWNFLNSAVGIQFCLSNIMIHQSQMIVARPTLSTNSFILSLLLKITTVSLNCINPWKSTLN